MVALKAENAISKNFEKILPKEVVEVFHKSFNRFTTVQVRAGSELLCHNDVVVESPTGSGKTLAFLIPLFSILKKKGQFSKNEIGALILSPSRELCTQIANVAGPYAEALNYNVVVSVGGNKVDRSLKKLKDSTCDILVATPGRLYQMLQYDKSDDIRKRLKAVEILVIDEADRFNESQFEVHIKEILAAVPKQKRIGLFSATQAKENSDLSIFALRNPKAIKLKEADNVVCPVALNNFFTVCKAAEKIMCMVEFVRSKPDKKLLLFFPSCSGVRYFKSILEHIITKRPLLAVHGKNTQKQRTDQITKFRQSSNAVMLSTDVMSRGIDIEDIDWVLQFEIPKLSSWFVHRAGRTARNGREGNALLFLTPEQIAYASFVGKHEKVELKELKVPTNSAEKAEQLRQKMIKIACADRAVLEQGTRAFVSHIESYVKHDCNVVCGLKELDVPGVAMAYGLLRLPKMRELTSRTDLGNFQRSDIDTSTIAYANPALEKNRGKVMEEKHKKKVDTLKQKLAEKREKEKGGKKKDNRVAADPKKEKMLKRKAEREERNEKSEFEADVRLLKKMKKGRLSSKELNDIRF